MNRKDEVHADGMRRLAKARCHDDNHKASPEAERLATFTGLIGRDIDTFIRFTRMHDLLIVARLPDFYAATYADELKSGAAMPKSGDLHQKTSADGTLTHNGQLFISDIDLMCAHKFDRNKQSFIPIPFEWDGRRSMNAEENRYFGALNNLLISRLQHGCNDNFVTNGRPNNPGVGTEFIGFDRGRTEVVYELRNLRMFYRRHRLQNWHPAYGCA